MLILFGPRLLKQLPQTYFSKHFMLCQGVGELELIPQLGGGVDKAK